MKRSLIVQMATALVVSFGIQLIPKLILRASVSPWWVFTIKES
jgi:hypothetical protein